MKCAQCLLTATDKAVKDGTPLKDIDFQGLVVSNAITVVEGASLCGSCAMKFIEAVFADTDRRRKTIEAVKDLVVKTMYPGGMAA